MASARRPTWPPAEWSLAGLSAPHPHMTLPATPLLKLTEAGAFSQNSSLFMSDESCNCPYFREEKTEEQATENQRLPRSVSLRSLFFSVEGLRVTPPKRSQEQDFTQVKFIFTRVEGRLAGFKGGRPAESGWCAQLSGVTGDILAPISFSW